MMLQHANVAALSAALKQRRQLTFGEQLQANELLAALRTEALKHLGVPYPNKEIDANDSASVRQLKRRGLMEVVMMAEDDAADMTDEQRALALGIAREACSDFAQAGHHHSVVNLPNAPPPKAMPKATNVEDARVPSLLALVGVLQQRVDALEASMLARFEAAAEDLLALDNAFRLHDHPPVTAPSDSSTSDAADGGKKEG